MKFRVFKQLSFIFVANLLLLSCQTQQSREKPYLIMLSLDGFRWDFTQTARTPVLDSLKKAGVVATSMKPSFPTKTFPNHYSIATGLYPDHHGIVLNHFFAVDLKRDYTMSNRAAVTDGSFYGGNPLWNLAESQGAKTATLFWVGASADIGGHRPSYWSLYDEKLPMQSRIDSLSRWLSLPETERPHLILWYYHEPDLTAHISGPQSEDLKAKVEELDAFLGRFFTAMRRLPVFSRLNFIITSDHGMTALSPDRVVLLDEFVDTADLEIINGSNPVYNFKVKEGKLDTVFSRLSEIPHAKVWKHGQLPQRLHYGTNIRTLDITLMAEGGWSLYWSWRQGKSKGTHGYDNDFRDMHAIFYAAGPAFRSGYEQPTFENVDIYPLVAKIMDLRAGKVDGKLEDVKGMLK